MLTQEQLLFLLTLLNEGKLPSELVELLTLNTDNNYLVLNNGLNDAKKIKVPLLRGYKGTYNASTNTPTLTNGVGLDGDMYVVSVAGTRDFGAGTVNLFVDDILIYLNGKYLKTNAIIDDSLSSSVFKTWSVDKLVATFIQASALASYLPLAGGTLTGTLNGTDANFSGNVGIGTNSPSEQLHIYNTGSTKVEIEGGANKDASLMLTETGSTGFRFNYAGVDNKLFIGSGTAGTFNTKLTIERDSGNVGIGTDSPSAKLEVNGALFVGDHTGVLTPTDGIWIEGADGDETQIQMYSLNGSVFSVKNAATKATIGYVSGQDRSVSLINSGAGDISVGINTPTPSEKLEVIGNVKADKFITGQLEINSDLNATNIVSDDENLYIKSDHTSGNVRLIADAAIYVQTGSSEDLAITASSSSGVGLWHIGSKKIGTTTTGASVTGNLEVSGTILPETNNVQTITGTTSSATIGANINVVVVDTTVNCTLTISTTTNIASIKVINVGTGNVYFSAGTGVTVNNNGGHIGVASSNKLYFSSILTKIATNSWIVSE